MAIKRRTFLKATTAFSAMGLMGAKSLKGHTNELLTKAIPSSGEEIPVIGIGTNRYGVGSSEAARAPLRATLKRFHELGGTLIDTAPIYKDSEIVLGDLISELGIANDLFMATKCHLKKTKAIRQSMEDSFKRLKMEEIDLMQVHSLRAWKKQLPILRELKQAGRIRYLGVTVSEGDEHEELARVMRKHELDFVQLNYSLGDRAAESELLPLAFEKGMAVMVNLPFGRGKLFKAVGDRPLPDWVQEAGCKSWGQFFLKYVVSHPVVTCAIPGTRKERHVIDNMGVTTQPFADKKFRKRQEEFFENL